MRKTGCLTDVEEKVTFVPGDIREITKLSEVVDNERIECIVHTAAIPLEAKCKENPEAAFNVNVVGTFNVAEVARRKSLRLINMSSQAVYGNLHERDLTSIREDEPLPPPKGVYPAQKLMGETLVTCYRNVFGVDAVSLRPNWVYGPFQATIENPISMILKKARKGEPFILDTGGDHRLAYTYVKDLANATFLAYKTNRLGTSVLNIDSGQFVSIKEVVEIIRNLYPEAKIRVGSGLWPELMKQAPLRGPADLSRAKTELGYDPKYPVQIGIKEYAEWLESMPKVT